MITKEERAWLRALADAATPGPWAKAAHGQETGRDGDTWWTVNRAHHDGNVLQVNQARQVCRVMSSFGNDAAFIAEARTAVPALLDALESAEAQLATRAQDLQGVLALIGAPRNSDAYLITVIHDYVEAALAADDGSGR